MIHVEKWQKDLAVYQDINTTFIVEGNVHDLQPWTYEDDGTCEPIHLSKYLHRYLVESGYDPVIFYNRIDGFNNLYDSNMVQTFFREIGEDAGRRTRPISEATELIRRALANTNRATAVIFDLANTIASSPDNLSEEEIEYFSRLMLSSMNQVQALSMKTDEMGRKKPLTNLLFLVVEKVNDIPAWFYLNNPYIRTLTITRPEKEVRTAVIDARLDFLSGAQSLGQSERKKILDEFAALTDGMTLVEIFGIISLCIKKKFDVHHIREAIKMFRYGETESHWDKLDREKIRNAEAFLAKRVKGQPHAIAKAASILSRACIGMSGIQGGSISRPKGVLFMAGPTGTGKTELAKTIAEFVFGDESFVTRFDMSEYGVAHADQKLLGAPPGYVGYSDGGQLTNAIKSKPFCVLLFDEIEKAHPTILDKFLQILEDGRITDSAGETMYFSEAMIIFTSNLGVVEQDENTGEKYQTITPEMDYETLQSTLLEKIKEFFKFKIQRPELLNRIGDNFIVFDFIDKEAAAQILELKINAVVKNIEHEKGLILKIQEPFRKYLYELAIRDLSNGGRGIGNLVETYLVNPLSNVLVQEEWKAGDVITVQSGPTDGTDRFIYSVTRS